MVESSIVLFQQSSMNSTINKVIDYNIGNACSVEFNFERIWNFWKEYSCTVLNLYFLHVHPKGLLDLSETDKNCMKGFYQAFGSPINFYIIAFENNDLFSTEFKLRSYIQQKWNYDRLTYPSILLNSATLHFLKYLSYGENNES